MEIIANHLTALRFMYHQLHLLSKKYQRHLIYDRLINPLDEMVDRVKEVALGSMYDEQIAYAFNSLAGAAELVKLTENITYESVKSFVFSLVKQINNYSATLEIKVNTDEAVIAESDFNCGIQNMLGDISETLLRQVYLLNTNLEG
jgi:hypothetical protein